MSDISLNLDGLLAFLVAAALGCALLLASVICLLYAWLRSRRTTVAIISQPVSTHIAGMLLSVAGFAAVALVIFVRDGQGFPHDVEQWLDRWVLVWAVAILLAWPLSAYAVRRGRRNITAAST